MASERDEVNMSSSSDGERERENVAVEPSYSRPKRRRHYLLHCGHCDSYLSKSAYYRHREAFFNPVSGQWLRLKEHSPTVVSAVSSDLALSESFDYEGGTGVATLY